MQDQPDGAPTRPIGYWSRTLNKDEGNHDATHRDCLAVEWAIIKLRPYLEDARFTMRTYHDAIRWILNLSDSSGQLQRWSRRISEFEIDTMHHPGIKHQAADALSRMLTEGFHDTTLEDEIPTVFAILESNDQDQDQAVTQHPLELMFDNERSPPKPSNREVLAISNDDAQNKRDRIELEDFIQMKAEDIYCRQVAQLVDVPGSQFSLDPQGLLVRL